MEPRYVAKLATLINDGLARFAEDQRAMIADGGTATPSYILMGKARQAINGTFPLIGVTVSGQIVYPGGSSDKVAGLFGLKRFLPPDKKRWRLEPRHSHFLIVQGETFGAESALLVGLADARPVPRLALIANGGDIVQKEAEMHAQRGTPLLTIKGTGRYADDLADSPPDGPLRKAFPPGAVIKVFDADRQTPREFYQLLYELLVKRP
jgi:hypothetical protein